MLLADRWFLIGCTVLVGGAFPVSPVASSLAVAASLAILAGTKRVTSMTALLAFAGFAFAASRADLTLGRAAVSYEAARDLVFPPAACELDVTIDGAPVVRDAQVSAIATVNDGACRAERVPEGTRVMLGGLPSDSVRGDRLFVRAELGLVQRFQNEGTQNRLTRIARTGASISGRVRAAEQRERGSGAGALVDRARAHARTRIEATYHPEAASLGRALVLGETDLDADADEAFRVTGLSHLLAVSGTHLVIAVLGLCAALHAVLVRVGTLAARCDVGRIAAISAVPLSWLYADFAGGGGSVLRAAAMVTAASLARALGRRPSPARCFAASLVAGSLVDPLALLDLSFSLSAAATLGLLTLSRPLAALLRAGPDHTRRLLGAADAPSAKTFLAKAWAKVGGSMATTLGATLACAPIVLSMSPTLPAAGVLANLFAAPLGEAFALPFALLHTVLAFVPPLERGAALVASGALRGVLLVARAARATGLVLPLPPPTAAALAAAGVAVVSALAFANRFRRALAVAAGLALVWALELRARDAGRPLEVLRISVLDVGQGDAVAIDLPDGSFMLVDGGGIPGSDFDVGERIIKPVLRHRRRSRIDVAVISHPHPDHYAGLVSTLADLDVGEIWDTGEAERDGPAHGDLAKIFADARARGIPIVRPRELCDAPRRFGEATVEVIAPCPEADPALSTNDASFVLRIRHGERTALLAGDLEREGETRLLEQNPAAIRADFLKVGHHGSKTSTSDAFLDAVSPRVAAISCGVRNRFGHPAPGVLEALARRGITVARTDTGGEWRWQTDRVVSGEP